MHCRRHRVKWQLSVTRHSRVERPEVSALAKTTTIANSGGIKYQRIAGGYFRRYCFALRKQPEILIDFTNASIKKNVICAIWKMCMWKSEHPGLRRQIIPKINEEALKHGVVGVIAAGNFFIICCLMMKFAELAAKHFPPGDHWIQLWRETRRPSGISPRTGGGLSKVKNRNIASVLENTIEINRRGTWRKQRDDYRD